MTTATAAGSLVTGAELDAIHATVEAGLPAFLADLERLCNIDCGSYTPQGVNEVADWVAADLASHGRVRRAPPRPVQSLRRHGHRDVRGRARSRAARAAHRAHGHGVLRGHGREAPFRIDDGIARARASAT